MIKHLRFLAFGIIFIIFGCQPNEYTLNFYDYGGDIFKSINVIEGESFFIPKLDDLPNKVFAGWDKNLILINTDLEIYPIFELKEYNVVFHDYEGNVFKTISVEHGSDVQSPSLPEVEGLIQVGWSKELTNITQDMLVFPNYEEIMLTLSLINEIGDKIGTIEEKYGTKITNLDNYLTQNNLNYDWYKSLNEPPILFPFHLKENITLTSIGYSRDLEFNSYQGGYAVSIGKNKDDLIIIPNFHNGNPVLKINDYGFQSSLILEVKIPSNIEIIGVRAFESSLLLEKINFDEKSSLKRIELDAFAFNQSLKEVRLPNGLETLDQGVFYNSNGLVSISIPRTLKHIGPYALTHNKRLNEILVDKDNPYFVSLNSVLYTKNFHTLLVYPSGLESTSYEIHPHTKVINDHAFDGSRVETLYLHENLEEIRSFNIVGAKLSEIIFPTNINVSLKTFNNSFHNFSSDLTIYVNSDYYNNLDDINSIGIFNQEITIKDISRRFLKDDIKFNLLKNTWVVRDNLFIEKNIRTFRDWSSINRNDYVYSYFYLKSSGTIDLIFHFDSQVKQTIDITFNGETRKVQLNPNSSYAWGEVEFIDQGHHSIMFKMNTNNSRNNIDLEYITLLGSSVQNGVGITDSNSSQMPASLHLWPNVQNSYGNIEWLYSEIIVEENNDILHTYFMANGFAQGYFGIQTNTTNFDERWVLFSIWSPYDTDNPNEIPDNYKVKLIRAGEGVEIREFGNEGSGGQSFLKYPWVVGNRYGFLNRIRPTGPNTTEYSAYFYDFSKEQWFFIATFERPKTNTYAKGWYQFLEVYTEDYGNLERTGHYGNYWVKNTNQKWFSVNRVLLTATDNARNGIRNDIQAGLSHFDGMIYLTTGGFNVSPVEIDRYLVIQSIQVKPDIDFDNLP